ncbi:Protein MAIN-LIKE 2 [Glycine soja]
MMRLGSCFRQGYKKNPGVRTSQRRRPTAFARRQLEAIPIAENVHHVDDAVDEVHKQPQEAAIDDKVVDAQGFLGGPHDTLVLTAYVDHAAVIVWNEEERPELKLSSHGRKVQKFGRATVEIEGLVAAIGLSAFHSFETLHVDEAVLLLVELLKVSADEARAKTIQCHEAYVRLSWLKCDVAHWTVATQAYLLHLLGCTLFANKSATHMHVVFLDTFRDLDQSGSYAWGTAALVHMYGNLNDASKSSDKQLLEYIILLQCWIYEHFPFVVEAITVEDYHERKPCACCWTSGKALPVSTYRKRLDRLTSDGVCWMPYGDHHAIREFELISLFSGHIRWGPVVVMLSYTDQRGLWVRFVLCLDSVRQTTSTNDTYVKPDIPQYSVDATTVEEAPADAPSHVEQPRHAVDACQEIAERLKRLLNLRIMTEGTKAYNVMEACLRIARGVTTECNIYVQL